MALKVWLPLNETLENKGTENITFSNTIPTYATNGKIGSALNIYATPQITINIPSLVNAQQFSFTFWYKPQTNSNNTSNWQLVFALADKNTNNTTGRLRIESSYGSVASTYAISIHNNTSYGIASVGYVLSSEWNTWHHIAFTCDGIKCRGYCDGVLKKEEDFLGGTLTGTGYIGSPSANSGADGLMNDIRIYDHCLSAAEVKDIAQGLVLHYKLDGPMGGANENIILTSNKVTSGGQSTNITREYMNDGSLKIVAGASNGNYASIGFQNNSNTNVGAKMQVGDTYTISCDIKVESGTRLPTLFINSGNGYKQLQGNIILNQWIRAYYTSTWAEPGSQYGNISLHLGFSNAIGTYYFKNFKLEKGNNPTPWTPAPEDLGIDTTIVEDSSGYGHNGEIISELHISNDTARYNSSTLFDGVDDCIIVPYNTVCPENIFTINLWFKKDAIGTKNYETLFGGPSGFEMDTRAGSATSLSLYMASTRSGNRNSVTSLSLGNWYMVTMTRDGTKEKYYINGIFQSEIDAKAMPTGVYYIGAWASSTKQNYYGNISDFRIYCTPLLDTDIKQLYNVGMKVDNLGGVHSFEFVEQQSNIIFPIELSRSNLEFTNGLSKYTQANCQVTLTDQGYHIYRPPNLTLANDGSTMWGGLKLVNQKTDITATYDDNRDNNWGLQKGHTYLVLCHASGQSTNATNFGWANNMGWSGGGLTPSPTQILNDCIPANFNGEKDCAYIFTINDDVIKPCTSAYSSYVVNTNYLSYRHMSLGWGYTSTGALGTDIYLTNFQLYDVTNSIGQIKKDGSILFTTFNEMNSVAKIRKKDEFLATEFIEM